MANHKATIKSSRQNSVRRLRNRYDKKTTSNLIRNFDAEKNANKKEKDLPQLFSHIDKIAKKGIIHKNKAANIKSRLALSIKQATAKTKKVSPLSEEIKKQSNEILDVSQNQEENKE